MSTKDTESQILAAVLKNLDDPRTCLKKYLKDTGQTYAVARKIVKLAKGESKDAAYRQRCPVVGCSDDAKSFFFTTGKDGDHIFCCSRCGFEGDIVDLIKKTANAVTDRTKTKGSKLENAKEWLKKYFRNRQGEILVSNLKTLLKRKEWDGNGEPILKEFSMSTVRSAAKELGAKTKRDGVGKGSQVSWVLPNWKRVCR